MRILVATDAFQPQVNGVVRTYERLAERLSARGEDLFFLTPYGFKTFPCPTYPSIRLALPSRVKCARFIESAQPDAIHVATEGPVGWMTRNYCIRHRIPFTTSFHTRFPEYVSSRLAIPEAITHALLRRFHNAGSGVMAATESLATHLRQHGYQRVMNWTRGVDTDLFRPRPVRKFGPGPVFLYVGRVAVEKNIGAFLELSLPGTKVVVGDGPALASLKKQFPGTVFTGQQTGEALAESYASADVFVFPSRTDTFGIVLLEAMASGLPIAAYPVMGPADVVQHGTSGVLGEDLAACAIAALNLDRANPRSAALTFSWDHAATVFLANLAWRIQSQRSPLTPSQKTLSGPGKISSRI
ncbi:MAG: glycosyltransferase family 1 protein [Hyphomicrobium sp.]